MFKRLPIFLVVLVSASTLLAQEAPQSDLERRTAEIQRQIDILTKEIEALKTRQTTKEVQADTQQYGLGAAASKVYRAQPGISIGGYGEMLYQNFDSAGSPANADLLRAVLYTGYKFTDRVLFNSEIEVEHGSTDEGGEVAMEFAYLDYLIRPEVNVRAGLMLVPVGLINEQHEPTAFFGARRPLVERVIIPATWGELGAGVFGDVGRVSYRAYVINGLEAEEFSAGSGIRGGRQGGAQATAEDWAVVGRADWHPFEGTMFGGSIYSGDAGQGEDFGARVTLGEVHGDAKFRGVSLRGLYARGSIGDAAEINRERALTGNRGIGKSFGGWYVEGGYDVASIWLHGEMSLAPFVRYERFNTQRSAATGFSSNPANDQKVMTVGVSFKPIQQTVIKLDWQNVDNQAGTGIDQWNIALGYIF